jgi:hypothetical protein
VRGQRVEGGGEGTANEVSGPGTAAARGTPPHSGHGRSAGKPVARIALEVLLISTGVFLALMGEQWREHHDHQRLSQEALGHFRSEFRTNRAAVAGVLERHAEGLKHLQYLNADARTQSGMEIPFDGTDPAFMEYAAWDLAMATQSLDFVDADLAQSISHVYAIQRQLDDATRAITQVMYLKAGSDDPRSFLGSMLIYFGDCTLIEPRLVKLYDEILPRLDRALGEPAGGPGQATSG